MTAASKERLRGLRNRSPRLQYLDRRRKLASKRPKLARLGVPGSLHPMQDRKRILLATNVGGFLNGTTMEATLAAALLARGHEVHVLLCDGVLPACLECTIGRLGNPQHMADHGPRRLLCPGCFSAGQKSFAEVGAMIHAFSELLDADDRAAAANLAAEVRGSDVSTVTVDGLAVGEHAQAGALRFFARATIDGEPQAEEVLRRYLEAAVLSARAVRRLVRQDIFDVAVFHHGIYVPQGVAGEVCRSEGLRVVNWNPGYRARTFVFSHGDSYHHTLVDEPIDTWERLGWDDEREGEVVAYLDSRRTGKSDWIWFHQHPEAHPRDVASAVGFDPDRPCVGLLTNVMWDAQLHYPANAFANMRDWIFDTIRWFAEHPELQLLIRVHPAEVTGGIPSRQLVTEEIAAAFPQLPANVFVIGPADPLGTYAAMLACDSVIIYGTKTGVELSAMGIPVIVAGEAWVRGKGVTIDVSTVDEYHEVLARLPLGKRLDAAVTRRARQYAYHFFFRRMIPLEFMEPTGGDPVCHNILSDATGLMPGASTGLDVIIEGILNGSPFVYPADSAASTGTP